MITIREIRFAVPAKLGYEMSNCNINPLDRIDFKEIVLNPRPSKADNLINNILEQIDTIKINGYEPDRVILGIDNYDILAADLCYRIGQAVKPKEFQGIKISIVPDDYCKVVADVEDEFLFRNSIRER